MTAVFIDANGNKKNFVWQYDKQQTLIVENLDYNISPEVHFATASSKEALIAFGDYDDGVLQVKVPDVLLLDARKITVYLYVNGSDQGETVKELDIFVRPRKRPNDYMYSDGNYIVDTISVENAINNYIENNMNMDDIVVDYTTVHLTDEANGEVYEVGVLGSKLYLSSTDEEVQIENADLIKY